MNTRAWAPAAMICALLLGTPTTLADDSSEDEESYDLLAPFDPLTESIQDTCVSMLDVTLVSFGGTIEETSSEVLDMEELLQGELHSTVTILEEVWTYPGEIPDLLAIGEVYEETVGPAFMEVIETTRTTIDMIEVDTPIHVEWSQDTVHWERVERSTLVPLPADLDGIDPMDIVEVCDDDPLRAEAPVQDSEYDYHCPNWWPEAFAPEAPENESYIRITDLTVGLEPEDGVEPKTLDEGLALAPSDVSDAVMQALAEHTPIIYDEVNDESDDAQAESEETSEGEEQDNAEAAASLDSGSVRSPVAKASAGSVGLAGLLGSVLMLRRRV